MPIPKKAADRSQLPVELPDLDGDFLDEEPEDLDESVDAEEEAPEEDELWDKGPEEESPLYLGDDLEDDFSSNAYTEKSDEEDEDDGDFAFEPIPDDEQESDEEPLEDEDTEDISEFEEDFEADEPDPTEPEGDETSEEDEKSKKGRPSGQELGEKAFDIAKTLGKKTLAGLVLAGGWILKILAKLPIIGGKIAGKTGSTLFSLIALALPLIMMLTSIMLVRAFNDQSGGDTTSLPDNGSVSVSTPEINDGTVTIEVENTGDVIADVKPGAIIYSSRWFNPLSWYVPAEVTRCTADWVEVEIEQTETVELTCDEEPAGWLMQAKGTVEG